MLDNKIRWCEWCGVSIPKGELYGKNGKQDICLGCRGKKRRRRNWIAGGLIALSLMVGLACSIAIDGRLKTNYNIASSAFIGMRQNRAVLLNLVHQTDKYVNNLASRIITLEQGLEEAKNGESGYFILLKTAREEIAKVTEAQSKIKNLLLDVTIKVGPNHLVKIRESLQRNIEVLKSRMDMLDRDPSVIMEKIIKPTVEIMVRNKLGVHQRGSGVLFRKKKLANGRYLYTGFTAYHVWEGVFKYLADRNKNPLLSNKHPKLVIRTYAGTYKIVRQFTNGEMIWPNKYQANLNGPRDFILFKFESSYNLATSELASDEEIKSTFVGNRVWVTGVAHTGSVSLYSGIVSNLDLGSRHGHSMGFHSFAYFGNSGGPIYDAKTLKIISITQRVAVVQTIGTISSKYAITDILIGSSIADVRKSWKKFAPSKLKSILDTK